MCFSVIKWAWCLQPGTLPSLRGTAVTPGAQGKNNIGSFYAPLHLGNIGLTDCFRNVSQMVSLWRTEVDRNGMNLVPVRKSAVTIDLKSPIAASFGSLKSSVAAVVRKILIDVGFCRTLQRPSVVQQFGGMGPEPWYSMAVVCMDGVLNDNIYNSSETKLDGNMEIAWNGHGYFKNCHIFSIKHLIHRRCTGRKLLLGRSSTGRKWLWSRRFYPSYITEFPMKLC